MDKSILIKTTKYSLLFRRIFQTYTIDVEIIIDGKRYVDQDVSTLLTTWCTDKHIKQTHNFQISQHGRQLFNFHDGPTDIIAAFSELPFVQQLHAERIVRYEVAMVVPQRSMSTRLKAMVSKLLTGGASK